MWILSSLGPGLGPWSQLNSKFMVKKGPDADVINSNAPTIPITFQCQYRGPKTRK